MKPKLYSKYLIGRRRLHKNVLFKKSQPVSVDIPLLLLNFTLIFFELFQIVLFFRVAVGDVTM